MVKRKVEQVGYRYIHVFRAQPLQRGYGLGGWGRAFLKTIAPVAKRGLLSLGKAALNAGARALEDVRDNDTSVKEALKKQAVNTFHPRNVINRSANKRKSSSQSTASKGKGASKRKKKKIVTDAPRLSK